MRPDMSKVIVERPRKGGGREKGTRERPLRCRYDPSDSDYGFNEEWDERAEYAGMKRSHHWNPKELNEHLGPLRRFLRTRVNRPWDKVYSEIRANLDVRNVVQKHVLQHLWDWVELHPRFTLDGTPLHSHHDSSRHWYFESTKIRDGFYVDPKGFLRYVGKKRQRRRSIPKVDPDVRMTDDTHGFRRLNGAWFSFELIRRVLPTGIVVTSEQRRQLSKKELRDYQLPRMSA